MSWQLGSLVKVTNVSDLPFAVSVNAKIGNVARLVDVITDYGHTGKNVMVIAAESPASSNIAFKELIWEHDVAPYSETSEADAVADQVHAALIMAESAFQVAANAACNDSQSDVIRWGIIVHQLNDIENTLENILMDAAPAKPSAAAVQRMQSDSQIVLNDEDLGSIVRVERDDLPD